MPSTKKVEHRLCIEWTGNGRYTAYCTCGWVEDHECESTRECADDWADHLVE